MIGSVEIEFATDVRALSIVKLQGAAAGLILKSSYTQVDCTLASLKVEDLNPITVHKEVRPFFVNKAKTLAQMRKTKIYC